MLEISDLSRNTVLTIEVNSSHEKQSTPCSMASFFCDPETFPKLTIASTRTQTELSHFENVHRFFDELICEVSLLFRFDEQFGTHDNTCMNYLKPINQESDKNKCLIDL